MQKKKKTENMKEYLRKYREAHLEYYREYHKEYYRKNRTKCREIANLSQKRRRKYNENDEGKKERLREYGRVYYLNHKDKYVEYAMKNRDKQREYREKHKEQQKAYRKANKTKLQEYQTKYRAENKEIRASAKSVCPAFWFLLSVHRKNLDTFLNFFKKGTNVARLGYDVCPAIKNCNTKQCKFCNSEGGEIQHECPMPHVFDFPDATQKIKIFVSKTKQKNK